MSKIDLLRSGRQFVKANRRYPTQAEVIELGIARTTMRDNFGNLSGYHDALYEQCKDILYDLKKERTKKIDVSKNKIFVITTAVTGDEVQESALLSLKTYCKKFDAKLIIHVAKGSSALGQTLDPLLKNESICLEDLTLNTNIKVVSLFQSGTKTDPTSGGISRTGKRDSSIILASPKQRLMYTATGIDKLPHATMGTGAITLPSYDTKKMGGYVADYDHVMGAVVIEVVDKERFHFRQIQFDKKGNLVDLGTYIQGNKVSFMAPEAMVLGDWHAGKTDKAVRKASFDITKALKIKKWILHDIFDGDSISHHDQGKLLLLAKKAMTARLNLKKELTILAFDIMEMISKVSEIVVVKSNHDEHLERYLDEGRFIKHPYNIELSLELATAMLSGLNPVKYFCSTQIAKKYFNRVKWLDRDESYKVAGIECGAHGDKGGNGSRGSIGSMEKAFGPCVFGHAHTPQILREAWCVGTSTETYADYGAGPSSWMNTHCLIYPNGMRQMINCIEGKFTERKL